MKIIFALLLIVNLLAFGWFKLDVAPIKIELQSREKNASAVKVVTGKLGTSATAEPITVAPSASPEVSPTVQPIATAAPKSTPAPTPAPTQAVKVAGHCIRWTGITGEQIDAAREKLRALGVTATETSSGESTKVWVYMPPLESQEAAKVKAAQLAELGINDYFVVNNGGRWQNAISLGIFSTREAGERHLAELQAKGVRSAVVRDRDDTLKQASFNAKNVSDLQFDKINKLSQQFKGSVLRDLACPR